MQRMPWQPVFVAGVTALLALRLLLLIDAHAVNVLFWDQWDLYSVFFDGAGWWETFRWQHGPHRQGVGFLLTGLVATLTGWDTRAEAFVVGGVVCSAAVVALALARRLFGRLSAADVAIPLLLLTPAQYGIFIHTPNVSHGAMPLLLLVLSGLAWTLRGDAQRLSAVVVLNALLVYTGFGIFSGLLVPSLLAAECLGAHRGSDARRLRGAAIALVASILSGASFLVGYVFDSGSHVALASPMDPRYWQYVALAFANVCGVKGMGALPTAVGAVVGAVAAAILAHHAVRVVRTGPSADPASAVIVFLVGFSLLFAVLSARGRLGHGLGMAQSTRYVPLLVPGFLGIFFHLRSLRPGRAQQALLALACAGLVAATFPMRTNEARFMAMLSRDKREWVEAYLATESISAADQQAGRRVYPLPPARTRMEQKLAHMKQRRLSFYRDAPPPEE